MTTIPAITTKGVIIKKHGGGSYLVELDNGQKIPCSLVQRFKVKNKRGNNRRIRSSELIEGDKVKIEIQLRDTGKGSIVAFA